MPASELERNRTIKALRNAATHSITEWSQNSTAERFQVKGEQAHQRVEQFWAAQTTFLLTRSPHSDRSTDREQVTLPTPAQIDASIWSFVGEKLENFLAIYNFSLLLLPDLDDDKKRLRLAEALLKIDPQSTQLAPLTDRLSELFSKSVFFEQDDRPLLVLRLLKLLLDMTTLSKKQNLEIAVNTILPLLDTVRVFLNGVPDQISFRRGSHAATLVEVEKTFSKLILLYGMERLHSHPDWETVDRHFTFDTMDPLSKGGLQSYGESNTWRLFAFPESEFTTHIIAHEQYMRNCRFATTYDEAVEQVRYFLQWVGRVHRALSGPHNPKAEAPDIAKRVKFMITKLANRAYHALKAATVNSKSSREVKEQLIQLKSLCETENIGTINPLPGEHWGYYNREMSLFWNFHQIVEVLAQAGLHRNSLPEDYALLPELGKLDEAMLQSIITELWRRQDGRSVRNMLYLVWKYKSVANTQIKELPFADGTVALWYALCIMDGRLNKEPSGLYLMRGKQNPETADFTLESQGISAMEIVGEIGKSFTRLLKAANLDDKLQNQIAARILSMSGCWPLKVGRRDPSDTLFSLANSTKGAISNISDVVTVAHKLSPNRLTAQYRRGVDRVKEFIAHRELDVMPYNDVLHPPHALGHLFTERKKELCQILRELVLSNDTPTSDKYAYFLYLFEQDELFKDASENYAQLFYFRRMIPSRAMTEGKMDVQVIARQMLEMEVGITRKKLRFSFYVLREFYYQGLISLASVIAVLARDTNDFEKNFDHFHRLFTDNSSTNLLRDIINMLLNFNISGHYEHAVMLPDLQKLFANDWFVESLFPKKYKGSVLKGTGIDITDQQKTKILLTFMSSALTAKGKR